MWHAHCKRLETRHAGLEPVLIYWSMHTKRVAICATQTRRFWYADGITFAPKDGVVHVCRLDGQISLQTSDYC